MRRQITLKGELIYLMKRHIVHSTPTSILNELISYIEIHIEDVYNIFMDQNKQIMNDYSIKSVYSETLASEKACKTHNVKNI